MIISERKLDITSRDECPQPGDVVAKRNGVKTEVNYAVAHYPGFVVNTRPTAKSIGVWEVVCPGERKPSITLSVYWGGEIKPGQPGQRLWYEVPSR